MTADNVIDECEFVAAEIRRLITTCGYSKNDTAVLLCNPDTVPRIKEAMAEYDISCYTDLPESIMTKPITRFIISALEATCLDTSEFLAYIRSGYVRVPETLENYSKRTVRRHNRLFARLKDKQISAAPQMTSVTKR
jgi:ATP-dependent helicase/DNAse subunit B